jgi:ATP-dependent Lon protease
MATSSRALPPDQELAVLPVRDTVLFPHAVAPLTVGRKSSVKLIQSLPEDDKLIAVVTQRDPRVDTPAPSDLFAVGTAGVVHKIVKMPNENYFVFVEGTRRIRILDTVQHEPFMKVKVEPLADVMPGADDSEFEALKRNVRDLFQEIVSNSTNLSEELQTVVLNLEDPAQLADFVAASLPSLNTRTRQELLETLDVRARLRHLIEELGREREVQRLRSKIQEDVQEKLGQAQREYFLREQMKAIQRELGEADEGQREIQELREKIEKAGMPEEVKKFRKRRPSIPWPEPTLTGWWRSPGRSRARARSTSSAPSRFSTKTTTTWRKSSSASWNTWPSSS